MELKEYILHLDAKTGQVCHAHSINEGLRTSNFHDVINVREVSPELDLAYAECEKALQAISEKVSADWSPQEMLSALRHDEHEATYALAALKKARGE
jgi:hypothetical protein